MKWYVEAPGGTVILSDGPGFDPVLGVERQPVTPEICKRNVSGKPVQITADVHSIEFFDTITGRARVRFSGKPDGLVVLFDSPGHDPASGEDLQPVTREIVDRVLRAASKQAPDNTKADPRAPFMSKPADTATSSSASAAQPPGPLAPPNEAGWMAIAGRSCWVWRDLQTSLNLTTTWSGSCESGAANGRGVQEWLINGTRSIWREVEYRAGHNVGQASVFTANGRRFVGLFEGFLPNGPGKLTLQDGQVFEGNWTKGCFKSGTGAWVVFMRSPEGCSFRKRP